MIALVTGANQGIGFALIEELAARLGENDRILLTGRDRTRVTDAATKLGGQVEGRVLDVTDASAVAKLAAELGAVDIVFSNAIGPLTPDRPQSEQADTFVAVANGGTHAMLRSFLPILRPGGRFIVVASSLGTLDHLDAPLRPLFDRVSLDQVESAVDQWLSAIHDGTAEASGWPEWINLPSKVAQVAAVRAVAAQRRPQDIADGTLVAAMCPGLVNTRASRPWFERVEEAQTPAEAAGKMLDFVLADLDPAAYGELIRFGQVLPWHGKDNNE
ncbi:SDR family NAD(P)-dependent oxidoreductase [Kibdelosporangium phytohabitans]|uniref:Carbonyl reductase n=1 Tax=Kibdelosporangium phytohabitans TaxID=860235 RepID=A0A0N9HZT9_9PSEU|nr:SDR family NAD(P)-dependent oxidoreductase [Kibdelosporangium phytohabitans]ALG07882.1 carbonyl reductase [Kibdelosporangium phytohabitans]MBE1471186.1 NAD(P)-dependent dehydrogenase (short-subunit alcohol dehydrogenase family) [Kibdelosporangium phytohabitans]